MNLENRRDQKGSLMDRGPCRCQAGSQPARRGGWDRRAPTGVSFRGWAGEWYLAC